MQFNAIGTRRYDLWLLAITATVIAFFLFVVYHFAPQADHYRSISELEVRADPMARLSIESLSKDQSQWSKITNPVNLGMNHQPYWLRFHLPPSPESSDTDLLEISYPLLDTLQIYFIDSESGAVLAEKQAGDNLPFADREIAHESFLFAVPRSENSLVVIVRVVTTGSIKLPLRLWKEQEYIEYTSQHNLLMGLFFGLLLAIGLSNSFFFLTTRNLSFLVYSGYVFSLMLTLAVLHGQAYAYLWPQQVWFQGRAVAVFANATLLFAVLFSRWLLRVEEHSPRLSRLLKLFVWVFVVNIGVCLLLPYALLIKVFLLLLSVVVIFILSMSIWLASKGVVLARYYAFAWFILLISGLSASLDNLNLVHLPVPSNYLLILGASVESLLLTLVLAISYKDNQDKLLNAQQQTLSKERETLEAREALLSVQQQYQDELEYKVQERTLELEVALRELSDANRELENLNTIDSLTGIRNRRHFDRRLQAEARRSRREQTPLSLAMIDIDHFKQINDQHGHAAGDACLCHVAALLPGILKRPSDDVCRYGGEEFAIILPNTELEGATQVVDEMRQALEHAPVLVDGKSLDMTISVGVATAVIGHEDQELALLKLADRMLYAAKQGGRNQVHGQLLSSGQQS